MDAITQGVSRLPPPSYAAAVTSALDAHSKAFNWADDVIEELDSAGLQAVVPVTASLSAEEIIRLGMDEVFHRVDGVVKSAAVVPGLLLERQRGLGQTTILRSRGGTREVVRAGADEFRMCCGLPYGAEVRSLAWTDKDIKGAGVTTSEVDRMAADLHKAIKAEVGTLTRLGVKFPVYESFEQDLYISGKKHGRVWYTIHVSPQAQLFLCMDGSTVIDVATPSALGALRESGGRDYADLLAISAAIQNLAVAGTWKMDFTMLQDASWRRAATQAVRTGSSSVSRDAWTGGAPPQIFDSLGRLLSAEVVEDRRVPACHAVPGMGIGHGFMSAGEVPPSIVVALGTDGGKAITGSVLCIRNMSTSGGFFLITTSLTANMVCRPLRQGPKLSPMTRDGLFSPTCTAALYGDRAGGVFVVADGIKIGTQTILNQLSQSRPTIVTARDVYAAYRYVLDLVALQGWEAESRGRAISVAVSGRWIGDVLIRYGDSPTPRWQVASAALSADITSGSEVIMDYGCSGLGRALLSSFIHCGRFRGISDLMLNRSGPFSEIAEQVVAQKYNQVQGVLPVPTTYVIDSEYMTRRADDGSVERYVYALGIAKMRCGEYLGSATILDESPILDEFIAANPESASRELANYAALQTTCNRGDIGYAVGQLAKLAQLPSVQIYAKGRNAESELLSSEYIGATRLFRRQGAPCDRVRELGHLVRNYSESSRQYAWPSDHNPGRECVLFAKEAGLLDELPDPGEVGYDSLTLLLASAPNQVF
jgi:hypothetical protein